MGDQRRQHAVPSVTASSTQSSVLSSVNRHGVDSGAAEIPRSDENLPESSTNEEMSAAASSSIAMRPSQQQRLRAATIGASASVTHGTHITYPSSGKRTVTRAQARAGMRAGSLVGGDNSTHPLLSPSTNDTAELSSGKSSGSTATASKHS